MYMQTHACLLIIYNDTFRIVNHTQFEYVHEYIYTVYMYIEYMRI